MLRALWLHRFLGLSHSRNHRRRRAAQARRYVRPQLEQLEERLTPSGQPLPFSTAANATQLQADFSTIDTNPAQSYTITLAPNTNFQLTTVLTITNTASVTIVGSGDTITAAAANRSFLIESGANVTLQDLTIAGGDVAGIVDGQFGGGAIRDTGGNVTLSNANIQGNTASGSSADGGGIYVGGNGKLTIQGGSTIQSNRAVGSAGTAAFPGGGSAQGGGIYVSGASTVQISDSTIRDNSAYGSQGFTYSTPGGGGGGIGGTALGGGLYVQGGSWNVTLTGDTFSDNSALGGVGGNGESGGNASASNTTGGIGGTGGTGGTAEGGAVCVSGNGTLTILNDLNSPTSDPSTMIGNFAQGGIGGTGGAGGLSNGAANNSSGGTGGDGGEATGGALEVNNFGTTTIGNTTFYGNSALAANGAGGGAAGMGGSGGGAAGTGGAGGFAQGGGVTVSDYGNFTLVNSTLAKNAATAGIADLGAGASASALGGGLIDNDTRNAITLDNNTLTQNTLNGNGTNFGAGVYVNTFALNPTLFNNVMQGNLGSSDLVVETGTTLSNATNNFIESVSPSSAVSTTNNTIGSATAQLGGAVGVTANGTPTGGPIFYPLLPSTVSIQGGTTNALSTIASVEGNPTTTTDEIGDNRFSNGGIDLGAVQSTADTTTSLTVSAITPIATSASDQTVPVSATVTSSNGTVNEGIVTFTLYNSSNAQVGNSVTANVSGGKASTSLTVPGGTAAGNYTVTAVYTDTSPADLFVTSSNSATLQIGQSSATIALSNVAPTTVSFGPNAQNVTAVATVTSSGGTVNEGAVTFELLLNGVVDNAVAPVTVNVVNGQAALTAGNPLVIPGNTPVATYTLQAAYNDPTGNLVSTTPATTALTIEQTTASLAIQNLSPTNLYTSSEAQNVTATVVVTSSSGTVNEGTATLELLDGGTQISSVTANVIGGEAQLTANNPLVIPANEPAGSYTLQAVYSDPSNNFLAAPFSQTLTIQQSTAQVVLSGVGAVVASPSEQTVNVTAAVTSTLTNGTVNEGTVTFAFYNSNNVQVGSSVTANVSGGTASAPLTLPGETPAGSYTLQASYTDSGGLVAAPATTTLTIQPAATSLSVGSLPALTASSSNQPVSVSAFVGGSNAAINQGTVTFTLVNGSNVPVSSAVQGSVLNGTANALLPVPGGLPAGTYFVRAAYTDNQGVFAGSISDSSLTLNSPPSSSSSPSPYQAALTVAIDTAALLLLNDTAAYPYLAGISQLFLGQPLPALTQLVPDILSELTYAGELGLIGLQAGINYANSIIGGT